MSLTIRSGRAVSLSPVCLDGQPIAALYLETRLEWWKIRLRTPRGAPRAAPRTTPRPRLLRLDGMILRNTGGAFRGKFSTWQILPRARRRIEHPQADVESLNTSHRQHPWRCACHLERTRLRVSAQPFLARRCPCDAELNRDLTELLCNPLNDDHRPYRPHRPGMNCAENGTSLEQLGLLP